VVLLAAAQANVPVHTYSPLEVKSSVVGYGRASKHQMQQMVRALLGLPRPPQPADAADALAVALCHIHASQARARFAAATASHRTGGAAQTLPHKSGRRSLAPSGAGRSRSRPARIQTLR